MEFNKKRGYVYLIKYNIVWCVNCRRKVLIGEIKDKLKEMLYKIATDNDFVIEEINIYSDYVHLVVDCSPQIYIPDIMKALKGVSARLLMKEDGEILKKDLYDDHLWNANYLVTTINENIENHIKDYIESQKIC